jgi:hypothetical protein
MVVSEEVHAPSIVNGEKRSGPPFAATVPTGL